MVKYVSFSSQLCQLNLFKHNPMQSTLLLNISDRAISFTESLGYLRKAGKLQPFLMEIVRQYILEQEAQAIPAIDIDTVEQLIIDFRIQKQLANPEKFQQWLVANSLNFADFRSQFAFRLQVDRLKASIVEPKLQEYFAQRQFFLERVVLSRIVVDSADLAKDLRQQLEQEGADFTQLAKKYSAVDDAVVGGVMGAVSRGQMPELMQSATANAVPGQIIGPMQIDDRFCLLKVEQLLPAKLEGQLQQELENQIFEEWLREKVQAAKVQLFAT